MSSVENLDIVGRYCKRQECTIGRICTIYGFEGKEEDLSSSASYCMAARQLEWSLRLSPSPSRAGYFGTAFNNVPGFKVSEDRDRGAESPLQDLQDLTYALPLHSTLTCQD